MTLRIKSNNIETSTLASLSQVKISTIAVTDSSFNVLDDLAVDTAGGYIKITGTGFASGCTVVVGTQTASAVTFTSSTELRVQVPALSAGTYTIYVSNPDGATAIRVNAINYSGTPNWVTGGILQSQFIDTLISIQLSATDATTYSVAAGSILPVGLTLSNSGLLSGTITGLANDTTYNFTIVATDAELQETPRTFSLTIITQIALTGVSISTSYNTFYVSEVLADGGTGRITFQGSKPENWGFIYFGITTLDPSGFRTPTATSTINSVDTGNTLSGQGVVWYLDFDDYAEYSPDLVRAHNSYQYTEYSKTNPFAFGWSRTGTSVTVTAINPSTNAVLYTRTASGIAGNPRLVLAGVASSSGVQISKVNVTEQTSPNIFFE